MASKNHLAPKSIIDKNGKRTTVYVSTGVRTSAPEIAEKFKKRQQANVAAAVAAASSPASRARQVEETPISPALRYSHSGWSKGRSSVHKSTGEKWDSRGFMRGGMHHVTGTRFDHEGYDKRGFDKKGRDHAGFDRDGFDKRGLRKDGANKAGFDSRGVYVKTGERVDQNGFLSDGFHAESGYNRAGRNREGFSRAGWNDDSEINQETGSRFNTDGFDIRGYDAHGFNRGGYDSWGFGRDGFNSYGRNERGYDRDGADVEGWHESGTPPLDTVRLLLDRTTSQPFLKSAIVAKVEYYLGVGYGLDADDYADEKRRFRNEQRVWDWVLHAGLVTPAGNRRYISSPEGPELLSDIELYGASFREFIAVRENRERGIDAELTLSMLRGTAS